MLYPILDPMKITFTGPLTQQHNFNAILHTIIVMMRVSPWFFFLFYHFILFNLPPSGPLESSTFTPIFSTPVSMSLFQIQVNTGGFVRKGICHKTKTKSHLQIAE